MRISDWSSDVCSSDLRPWKLRAKNLIERWRRKMNKPVKAQLGVLSRLIASQPKAPNPTGASRVLTPENPETKTINEPIVRQPDDKLAAHDAILNTLETQHPHNFTCAAHQPRATKTHRKHMTIR